ncbi:glycosyltransferase family 4 protein [Gemmatimonas phototrophica]|uniref:Glycosyltransferase subfamily 4-like N-terminal domain-containing protein n=1 Tax=Gemmatimonas phototrophica TaxID=1379270 RepID=A0A143BHX0_9BACT|nr:glycosyltransferase family 4 protein [Gemmatimonas phototrophica]AMW04004.1 hypothetical protein GEMMAAP_02450 [Gemmatimonas phototrophica]
MTRGVLHDHTRPLVLVVGTDPAARERTLASLAEQSVTVRVLAPGESVATISSSLLVLVAAGAELDATACERCAWYLATHPRAGWVSGGTYSESAPDTSLRMMLNVVAFRTSEVRQALGDAVWRLAGDSGRATPGITLRSVVSLLRTGAVGGWLDPVLRDVSSGAEAEGDLLQAEASLALLSLSERDLVEPRLLVPSGIPLQRVEAPVVPTLPVVCHDASGERVLALLQGFPMGGYAAFNADLIPRLAARGHVVTTALLEWWRSDWRLAQVRAVAPDIHHVPSVVPFSGIVAYLEHLIRSRGITVVFMSHSFLGYRLLMTLRATFPDVAFVDYVHTEWFEAPMYGSYATMSARWSHALDAQVTSSAALAAQMIRDGADASRTQVAHIGVDTAWWSRDGVDQEEIRTAFGANGNSIVMLFAGRVSPEKRPLLAVDALERLRAAGHDVRLVVAGDGPLLRELHDAVVARGLEPWASLLGEVDEDTLRQVYAAADLFFAPSEIEGIARTLYEAMAMGCVPVVSDVGGQRELVVPGTGSLVAPLPGTVESYLPALTSWCDRRARERASAAARQHIVAHFDSAHTVHAIEQALHAARQRVPRTGVAAPAELTEEVAVLGLEVARRHAAAIAAAMNRKL